MRRRTVWLAATMFLAVGAGAQAAEITLQQVTFPERKTIELEFTRYENAPQAMVSARVTHREGQAAIDLRFEDMKPAILFGGDVTCYVLWAVVPDGTVENLGELWVREEDERVEYSTGLKSFALLVTAESHSLVATPSELVMFSSAAPPAKKAPSGPFVFRELADAPDTEYPSVAVVLWDKRQNLDLRQAEKAHELAIEAGAEQYAPSQLRRSFTTLTQARNLAAVNKTKAAIDYSRRTVALSAEALYTTQRRKEAEALEAEIARRKAEMEALEQRARDAEEGAAQASAALAEVEQQRAETEMRRAAAEAAVLAADQELQRLAQEKSALERSMAELEERARRLRAEKEDLSDRLEGALSQVAETRESARGMIVNLPDILFATNQAELKGEARVVIAKLAGILLIMDELNLRVEGHTDSTGSAEYNQGLSERRAASVRDFLATQGIGMNRMVAVGYGLTRPVADNSTSEGRARNRRVEIVIAEGTVAEAGGP